MNKSKIGIISLIVCIIDQIIKILITTNLKLVETIHIIKNFFRITYVQNTGAAFSIFENNKILLILLSILILGILVYYINKKEINKLEIVLYGILIGGILGNLIDRIRFGYVIDYLDFNFGSYNYPIFNFADMCIVVSGIFLIIKLMKED